MDGKYSKVCKLGGSMMIERMQDERVSCCLACLSVHSMSIIIMCRKTVNQT